MSRAQPLAMLTHAPHDVVAVATAAEHGCAAPAARTAAHLRADASRVERALDVLGIGRGDEVAVVCRDRYRFAATLLGLWLRGARVALLPNAQPGTVETAGTSRLVLHDGHLAAPHVDLRDWLADDDAGLDPTPWPHALDPAQPLATLYTSGTTGAARACAKSAQQLYGEAQVLARTFGIARGTCFVSTVPPHHIYGLLFSVLLPLVAGGCFVRETPLHAESVAHVLRLVAGERVPTLVSVPAHLRSLEALAPGALPPRLRTFSSSAPLPRQTARMLAERHGAEVRGVLGSTETGGIAWRDAARDEPWIVFDGLEAALEDDAPEGRLLLDSPFLPADAPRPWACADLVRLLPRDADGRQRFVHLGRADDVVKLGGKRVSLGEVRERLLAIPGVEDAVVQAVAAGAGRGQALRAAVVAPGLEVEAIRRALARWFDAAVLPRRLIKVEHLPRTSSGKLPAAAVDALFARARGTAPTIIPCGDPEPASRPNAWRCTLEVPRELAFFEGHFPDAPILPAIAQLERIVLPAVRRVAPAFDPLARLTRLKFRAPIRPGDPLVLELEQQAPDRIAFSLRGAADEPDALPRSEGLLRAGAP